MKFLLLCPAALLLLACLTARANGASPTGKGDSSPGVSRKGDSLLSTPIKGKSNLITDDTLLLVITKDKPPPRRKFPSSRNEEVEELRKKVIRLEREKRSLAYELRYVNRQLKENSDSSLKSKYIKLIRDLRQRISTDIEELPGLAEATTEAPTEPTQNPLHKRWPRPNDLPFKIDKLH